MSDNLKSVFESYDEADQNNVCVKKLCKQRDLPRSAVKKVIDTKVVAQRQNMSMNKL